MAGNSWQLRPSSFGRCVMASCSLWLIDWAVWCQCWKALAMSRLIILLATWTIFLINFLSFSASSLRASKRFFVSASFSAIARRCRSAAARR